MRIIEHTIDIPAAPAKVWEVLADTDAYPEWNPFMTRLVGNLHEGERVAISIVAGTRTTTFRPTIRSVDPPRMLRWLGRLGIPGLFDGDHEFLLVPTDDGGTRFTQRERFSGLLVPLVRKLLDDTDRGFAAMNEALSTRVTARPGRSSVRS
jgi:hypothetical protein